MGHSPAPKIAVGYRRVSTQEQAREGVSLDAQQARITAYCQAQGLELAGVHSDDGISGRKASNRPGLDQALRVICSARGVLVVYSLSRLARSTKDAILIAERLDNAQAQLVLLSESVDTRTASGRMFYAVLAALAAFESDLIGERTKLALDHKRRARQRYCANAPYGWTFSSDGSLRPLAAEQRVVRHMVALRNRGLSLRAIEATLAHDGVKNRNGSSFPNQQIGVILRRGVPA